MPCILHIETSTTVCSVAISEDGLAIFNKEDFNGPSHAVSLGVFVDEALEVIAAEAHKPPSVRFHVESVSARNQQQDK